jgi:hypothetical protein
MYMHYLHLIHLLSLSLPPPSPHPGSSPPLGSAFCEIFRQTSTACFLSECHPWSFVKKRHCPMGHLQHGPFSHRLCSSQKKVSWRIIHDRGLIFCHRYSHTHCVHCLCLMLYILPFMSVYLSIYLSSIYLWSTYYLSTAPQNTMAEVAISKAHTV